MFGISFLAVVLPFKYWHVCDPGGWINAEIICLALFDALSGSLERGHYIFTPSDLFSRVSEGRQEQPQILAKIRTSMKYECRIPTKGDAKKKQSSSPTTEQPLLVVMNKCLELMLYLLLTSVLFGDF
jgi:hypothetical protein